MLGSNYFTFLGLQVHWYGVLIATGIALGVALASARLAQVCSIFLPERL